MAREEAARNARQAKQAKTNQHEKDLDPPEPKHIDEIHQRHEVQHFDISQDDQHNQEPDTHQCPQEEGQSEEQATQELDASKGEQEQEEGTQPPVGMQGKETSQPSYFDIAVSDTPVPSQKDEESEPENDVRENPNVNEERQSQGEESDTQSRDQLDGSEREDMPTKIKVATDCSGMEAPMMALQNLNLDYEHTFSSDITRQARCTVKHNTSPHILHHDLQDRSNDKAPGVDIYRVGAPCQPFSSVGKRGGEDQTGRDLIFFHLFEYIAKHKPQLVILGNVAGKMTGEGAKYLRRVEEELANLGV